MMMPSARDELGRIRAEALRAEAEAERVRRTVRRPSLRRAEPGREGER
jgi:hypothetical protein